MRIKQQVWLAASASILLLGSMITISILFMEGGPRLLTAGLGAGGILVSIGILYSIQRNIDRGLGRITEISQDIAAGIFDPAAAATVRKDEFGQLSASFSGWQLSSITEPQMSANCGLEPRNRPGLIRRCLRWRCCFKALSS